MGSTTPSSLSSKKSLLSNRNFILLWAGQTFSLLGDAIFDITLIVWVAVVLSKNTAWGPLAVSGILIATSLPVLLIGPWAGVFVDRWNKRRTMLIMDMLRTLLIGSLVLVSGAIPLPFLTGGMLLPIVQLGFSYIVVFLASTCTQFFGPARLVLLGDVIEEPQRVPAFGMQQVTQSLVSILGPPLAAPLLFGFGVQWALLINAFSFCLSFLMITFVRVPPLALSVTSSHKGEIGREFLQGVHFVFNQRVIRALLIGVFITALGGGAINALNVFFLTQNLHTQVSLVGIWDAVFGVGIIMGALLTSAFARRIGLELTFSSGVLGVGFCFVVLSRMTSAAPALGLMCLLGVFQGAISVTSGPLILQSAPRELIGRVASVLNPLPTLASLVSVTFAGYLASTILRDFHATVLGMKFGSIDTIFTGAGTLITLGGIYLLQSQISFTSSREKQGKNPSSDSQSDY